ncbi:hypothetical protein PSPO_b0771 [Pseudoalteromonas spongiae UST010723-006]|nr:hypothetical protein PSPO_b0771 [Pseudoalteromonas spongiae UST010723-006]
MLLKTKLKESIGVVLALSVFLLALFGLFALSPYITIYGSAAILLLMIGLFKYV